MKSPIENAKETVQHKINTSLRIFVNQLHANFPPHWHTDIEIICPKDAPYRVICGNQSFDVEVGDILFICPTVLHEIYSITPGSRMYIQADFSRFSPLTEIERAFRQLSPALHIKKKTCPPELYDFLYDCFNKVMKLYFGSVPSMHDVYDEHEEQRISYTELTPYNELEIYSILMQFIACCGKNAAIIQGDNSEAKNTSLKNNMTLSSVCTYISQNFSQDITLESAAAYSGFSKYHFERIFRDYTGMTFYQYLLQLRINYAKTLLSNPDLSITDISDQAGFASCTAFTRAFKKSTGYPPSQFRTMNEQKHPLSANQHFSNIKTDIG